MSGDARLRMARVAELVDGRVEGDPSFEVSGIRPVEEAGPQELALLGSRRYLSYVDGSTAGAYLVSEELEESVPEGLPKVVVRDVQRALLRLLEHFHPPREPGAAGVHPTAVLGSGVRLGRDVRIGPYAVLGDGVSVGDRTRIDAHVVLGESATVGPDCHIHPQVVVYPGTSLGARVFVHAGVRLGSDGFGYHFADGAHRKIPQVGRCIIGDDVEIGANTTIDRGSLGDTVVGDGVKIDNLVMLAHNVRVGPASLLAAMVGIAGSTRVGRGVWMGGQAGAIGHLQIGDGAKVAVASRVMRDVPPGDTVSGHPARSHREDLRRQAQLSRVPKLLERIEALEEKVREMEDQMGAVPTEAGADRGRAGSAGREGADGAAPRERDA